MKLQNNKNLPFFAALSAFLSLVESLIILPLPFFKLGIANIPITIGFAFFNIKEIIYITVFKIIISHLLRGTLFGYPVIVAICGNIIFLAMAIPLFHLLKKHASFISISLIGAIAHTLGQVAGAALFIPVRSLIYPALLALIIGFITGIINGVICNKIYYIFERGMKYENSSL